MIICFTGTGNSRSVADKLQESLGDEVLRMPPGHMIDPTKAVVRVADGRAIWVMPVHAWSVPWIVRRIISKMRLQAPDDVVHHLVLTCGDDIGYADKVWRHAIEQRGWRTGSAFSVQMPNSYTFLPGFDVDKPEVAEAKLQAMPDRVDSIIDSIDAIQDEVKVDVVRGSFPWLKTNVLSWIFNKFLRSPRNFKVSEACVGCGSCMRNCPTVNITMSEGKPKWGDICVLCTRCYQVCPCHAISYSLGGKKKGQYLCPGFALRK